MPSSGNSLRHLDWNESSRTLRRSTDATSPPEEQAPTHSRPTKRRRNRDCQACWEGTREATDSAGGSRYHCDRSTDSERRRLGRRPNRIRRCSRRLQDIACNGRSYASSCTRRLHDLVYRLCSCAGRHANGRYRSRRRSQPSRGSVNRRRYARRL